MAGGLPDTEDGETFDRATVARAAHSAKARWSGGIGSRARSDVAATTVGSTTVATRSSTRRAIASSCWSSNDSRISFLARGYDPELFRMQLP